MDNTISTRNRKLLLAGLAFAAFISLGLPDGLTGVAYPSIRLTFGLPLEALGALVTTGTIGYLVSSFSSGRLLARLGVGGLLALSCAATAISLLGYGFAPIWALMVGLGLLSGLGAGAIDAGLNTYAAGYFSPRMVNWLHACYGIGAATGPLIMSAVIGAGASWRLGFWFVGVAQLLLAACFALTRGRWRDRAHETPSPQAPHTPLRATLALSSTWLGIPLFFLYSGLEITAGQWLYTLLTEARGVAPALAGATVSAYWGSLTLGRMLAGVGVAHVPVTTLLRFCMAAAVLGILMLWLDIAPWISVAGVALLGAALAPMYPSFISLTPARVGPAHTANTVGFQVSGAMLGGALLVSAFGLLAGRAGLETLGPFLLGAALLLALLFEILERHSGQRLDERAA